MGSSFPLVPAKCGPLCQSRPPRLFAGARKRAGGSAWWRGETFWSDGLFSPLSTDGSGKIDGTELLTVMKSLGQAPDESEVADMIFDVDANGDGEIDFEEFLVMMSKRLGTGNNQDEELRQAFKVFDKDGDGYITATELKLVMKQLGEDLTDDQLADMVKEAGKRKGKNVLPLREDNLAQTLNFSFQDMDGDGRIDYEEFKRMMGGK